METQETETPTPAGGEPWFISRPAEILMDLPYAGRWEVTRRHPYYLRFWEDAQRYYQAPSSDPDQREMEEAIAQLLLTTLGVRAAPPPPGAAPKAWGRGTCTRPGKAAPWPRRPFAAWPASCCSTR